MTAIIKSLFLFIILVSPGFAFTIDKTIGAIKYSSNFTADSDIQSPKSARFSIDGKKLYVNSLEAGKTVVYAWPSLQKIKVIQHSFNNEPALFNETEFFGKAITPNFNKFTGKPVESELIKNGKFLLIPYYRRSFDPSGLDLSAMAIVDTATDTIVRVVPTGLISKYVTVSHDQSKIAVINWGDNTIAIMDASSDNPFDWHYIKQMAVGHRLNAANLGGTNRDATCGFCLRGSIFTPDDKYLIVSRMGGGGLELISTDTWTSVGTDYSVPPTPRHVLLSDDGKSLFVRGIRIS